MSADPFRLQRFADAQAPVWDDVTAELRAGRKRTHWMWFVFPQLAALGRSGTARFFGIAGAEEARAYLEHPVLGPRLLECCDLLLAVRDRSATEVFGEVDAMKLRSCLTLFEAVAPGSRAFSECLEAWFGGQRDPLTTALLAR
ncbi:DUF1810 domain-containing protein [Ramlibacter tataouinensis]|uniref:DUF1810 domain-containing protein n=1 Tax=Ramlibacter tataouinensis TaxID=94132 RepID=UPI0022F3A56A|nr:DUF1810 domain-containing protein [Ramlibacter tataouinensis]WBY02863.1 DUF1810 domain-containing protein [Ramlibacter tataouinensis]